jgi:hypothetical protein
MVNKFIEGIIARNGDGALASIAEAERFGVSMNTFSTLILEKMRFILLIKHSPSTKAEIRERVSPDDMMFIEAQVAEGRVIGNAKNAIGGITPEILSIMLEAVQGISRASIEQLPLELAVVKICK